MKSPKFKDGSDRIRPASHDKSWVMRSEAKIGNEGTDGNPEKNETDPNAPKLLAIELPSLFRKYNKTLREKGDKSMRKNPPPKIQNQKPFPITHHKTPRSTTNKHKQAGWIRLAGRLVD